MDLREAKQYLNNKGYELIDEGLFGFGFDAKKVKAGYTELLGYLNKVMENYERTGIKHIEFNGGMTIAIQNILKALEADKIDRAKELHGWFKDTDDFYVRMSGWTQEYARKLERLEDDDDAMEHTYNHYKHVFIKEIYPHLQKFGIVSNLKAFDEDTFTEKAFNKVIGEIGRIKLDVSKLKF